MKKGHHPKLALTKESRKPIQRQRKGKNTFYTYRLIGNKKIFRQKDGKKVQLKKKIGNLTLKSSKVI